MFDFSKTVEVSPWDGTNPLCDEKISQIEEIIGSSVTMQVIDERIFISSGIKREDLKKTLIQEGIGVIEEN